ncbi:MULTISPECIES: DEAD/DEAH box helicase [Shewanella]|jgi:ATP-dependent RNA helicase RhlE|uniref:DEAD/DEAH box helicase n=1 Tax=Shewanella psychromarinicola TaxID=2487742 RepID=A0A3N4EA28_9GAMM|nr:DEAD/DEAH box helicase [Shewanella psychromarinicola]AZG37200.1 DEAD/DEAH box helicase [Shewanella psychromarinicola]MCL1081772.1 DEAD/DEAH box helicase [Shewanella psychromarinicola]RPA35055.1 DEAD/DEAH box helicase [Shewanella psychromarinicola]
MPFSTLALSPALLSALPARLHEPTRIQTLAIPAILAGKDVLALAQTGSGKTYAYGLPLLQTVNAQVNADITAIQALVIVPTRELASQVHDTLNPIAMALDITMDLLCGGELQSLQVDRLHKPADIIVATPGRLLELTQQKIVDLSSVKRLVLDEADRLLDMGFIADITKLLALMPNRQTLLFSATFPEPLVQLTQQVLSKNCQRIEANVLNSAVDEIEQQLYLVNKGSKAQALINLINQHQWSQVLVFINAKDDADSLTKKLLKAGISSAALHGDKDQTLRRQTLADFKAQKVSVLVATDLLARGIDIEALPVVINANLPNSAPVYVHRIGRTARAGLQGVAISLVSHSEMESLNAIRALTQKALPLQALVGFPVTDKPSDSSSKRPPRDKQANRRTTNKRSIRDFTPHKKT